MDCDAGNRSKLQVTGDLSWVQGDDPFQVARLFMRYNDVNISANPAVSSNTNAPYTLHPKT